MWIVGILTNMEPEGSREPLASFSAYSSVYTSAVSGNPASPRIPENSSPPSSPSHWLAQGGLEWLCCSNPVPGSPGWKEICMEMQTCLLGLCSAFKGWLYILIISESQTIWLRPTILILAPVCAVQSSRTVCFWKIPPCEWLPAVAKETKISPVPMFLLKKLLLHSWDH